MSELIIINATHQIRHMENKLSMFVFPIGLAPEMLQQVYQECFSNWKKKTANSEEYFPSNFLMDLLEIEGKYERSYFFRTLQEFQRQMNELFLMHNVFDDLAYGPYYCMNVYRSFLRFQPSDIISNARMCTNDLRFSKSRTTA